MIVQLRPRILVIDDSILVRLKVQGALNKERLNLVGEAEDGEEGFKKYKELKPDIILLDLEMEKLDGINFLKRLREHDKDTIVIIISSHSDLEKVKESISLGVSNYIVKPIIEKNLLELIMLEWVKFKKNKNIFN